MGFARNSIDGLKESLIVLVIIIIASAIGASIISFEILLYGLGVISLIGLVSYILGITNEDQILSED